MNEVEEFTPIQIVLPTLHCLRCGYTWIPRQTKLPQHCPDCNSPYWMKNRRRPKKETN